MSRDPILDSLKPRVDQTGYRILQYDPAGEFPEGCVAARITGPELPAKGLPFCVPAIDKDVWAGRICLALSAAFEAGGKSRHSRQ